MKEDFISFEKNLEKNETNLKTLAKFTTLWDAIESLRNQVELFEPYGSIERNIFFAKKSITVKRLAEKAMFEFLKFKEKLESKRKFKIQKAKAEIRTLKDKIQAQDK